MLVITRAKVLLFPQVDHQNFGSHALQTSQHSTPSLSHLHIQCYPGVGYNQHHDKWQHLPYLFTIFLLSKLKPICVTTEPYQHALLQEFPSVVLLQA